MPSLPPAQVTLLLDPVKGGPFQGVAGPGGMTEAAAALRLALDLKTLLWALAASQDRRLEVRMTREDDQQVPLSWRVRMAGRADLTLSLGFRSADPAPATEALKVRAVNTCPVGWPLALAIGERLRWAGLETVVEHNGRHAYYHHQPKPVVRLYAGHITRPATEVAIRQGLWTAQLARLLAPALLQAVGASPSSLGASSST